MPWDRWRHRRRSDVIHWHSTADRSKFWDKGGNTAGPWDERSKINDYEGYLLASLSSHVVTSKSTMYFQSVTRAVAIPSPKRSVVAAWTHHVHSRHISLLVPILPGQVTFYVLCSCSEHYSHSARIVRRSAEKSCLWKEMKTIGSKGAKLYLWTYHEFPSDTQKVKEGQIT